MERKRYAMWRMAEALARAIRASRPADKIQAARWAAAWGVVSGIRSPGVRLRRTALSGGSRIH
ncbi:MAG: hypothetical protein V4484_05055 [Pseudomonadota bacterium]